MEPLNCKELEPLLTPYVDGEIAPSERGRVARHLDACRPCAARAAGEEAAQRLIRLRAGAIARPAPADLRARCAALCGRRRAARNRWTAWRGVVLAGATAVLVILTGVIGYAAVTHSPTLLVAGLTLDHLKCFAFSEGSSGPADVRVLEARLEHDYGRRVAVPAGDRGERLTLVGARRCFSSDGAIAHVLYRHAGRPVSLFVLPERVHEAASMSFAGHPARIWSRGSRTFILVGSESDAGMRPVAKYFESTTY